MHPKYSTPYVAIIFFSVIAVLLMIPNGAVSFLGQPVRVRGDAVVHARACVGDPDATDDVLRRLPCRGPTSFRIGNSDLPTFAVLGGIGTFVSWLVTVFLHLGDYVALVGILWLALGMTVYYVYRRSQGLPLTSVLTRRLTAPPRGRVPLDPDADHLPPGGDVMTATALRRPPRSGQLVALYPIEVPLNVSMADPMTPRRPRPSSSCARRPRSAASTVST